MAEELTAYIDMEFAGIYGTHQRLQIPIEIGVVLHDPASDTITFSGRAFSRNIEVELWKNVTDDIGRRINGNRRVFNLLNPAHSLEFDRKFHLDREGYRRARAAIAGVNADLRAFMQALNHLTITTLTFFARRREIETFQHARVNLDGFIIRDLQTEIKNEFSLKEDLSLDRVSLITGFTLRNTEISSAHFSYTVPEKYRYIIKPHKALGDAARMLLVSQEFAAHRQDLEDRVREHVNTYEARKIAPEPLENA